MSERDVRQDDAFEKNARKHDEEIRERRERALDKTVADTFPTSDPPSSIPDPSADEPLAA